jgi:hypothetical protein
MREELHDLCSSRVWPYPVRVSLEHTPATTCVSVGSHALHRGHPHASLLVVALTLALPHATDHLPPVRSRRP